MKPRYIIILNHDKFYAQIRQIPGIWLFDTCTPHYSTALNNISQLLLDGHYPDLHNFRRFLQDVFLLNTYSQ